MATDGRHFNDSSGGCRSKSCSGKPGALQELQLKALPFSIPRDSGCYTGSPLTASSPTVAHTPPSHFPFDAEMDTESSGAQSSLVNNSSSNPHASGHHHDMGMDSDDDDVFHLSQDSFIDSGLQSMSIHLEDGSSFTRPFTPYKQEERSHCRESDEESSTNSGDFCTADFEFDMGTASEPIDIPTASGSSSPGTDDTEVEDVTERAAASAVEQPVRRLLRRATVGQLELLERPQRQHADEHRNEVRPMSMIEGARGPLPDVVTSGLRRNRAMSESAIDSHYQAMVVGTSLQRMSDEFSNTTRQKHLNLMQMRQARTAPQVNSYPKAKPKSSNPFSRLFGSSRD